MQKAEEIERVKKKVMFAGDSVEKETVFTPYQKARKQLNFSAMERKAISFLSKAQYEELNSLMRLYSQQELNSFFEEKGESILRWALLYSSDYRPFYNLSKIMPHQIFCVIISNENFSILNSFFNAQRLMEKHGQYNELETSLAIEKLKTLLQIENVEINEFIKKNATGALKSLFDSQSFGINANV